MNKAVPKIFLSAWLVWLVYQVFLLVTRVAAIRSQGSPSEWGAAVGGPVLVGAGAWLAWRLEQKYHRATLVEFIIVCAILIWKFWLGTIFLNLLPAFGGHSFNESVSMWFSNGTASFRVALATFLPPVLLVASITYWPVHCRTRGQTH